MKMKESNKIPLSAVGLLNIIFIMRFIGITNNPDLEL